MKKPEPVTLKGRHVRLEPLEPRHLAGLAAAGAEDPDVFRFMTLSPITAGWETWYAEAMAGQASGRYVAWATVLAADGRPIGSTRFGDLEPAHGRVEIGWTWLGGPYQRTAANTEAKYLQLRHAFEDLGANRVAFKTDLRNERAQRALERIGGVREGVLRQHIRLPDGFIRDSVYYSILASEWPGVRARLEQRIAEKLEASSAQRAG